MTRKTILANLSQFYFQISSMNFLTSSFILTQIQEVPHITFMASL